MPSNLQAVWGTSFRELPSSQDISFAMTRIIAAWSAPCEYVKGCYWYRGNIGISRSLFSSFSAFPALEPLDLAR